MDELFNELTRVIAHPHTAITDHDRIRAARVLLAVNEYREVGGFYEYANGVIDALERRSKMKSSIA